MSLSLYWKEDEMKSLNEVAKALSICGRHPDCKGCPYENISYPTEIGNTCKDIMHYDALYYIQDRIDKCQEENSPLTWNELKTMEGKPVWVEVDGKWSERFWAFVEVRNDSYVNFFQKGQEYPDDLWKSGMGKTWNAFRKERYES